MFKGTKKAFERAPQFFTGHHVKDPETEIWTKDFAAAKVAMNTIDREIKSSHDSVVAYVKTSLALYESFTEMANCDADSQISGKIPISTNVYGPIQESVGVIDSHARSHAVQAGRYIDEIRSLIESVEKLLHKADRKKIDCDRVVYRDGLNYEDPASANVPEVKEYLMYHYHVLSLVPQVLQTLDRLLQLLIYKQSNYQYSIYEHIATSVQTILDTLKIAKSADKVAILQTWSTEIDPVVKKLSQTKTIGAAAVAPPPPGTWKRVQHVPHDVVSSVPGTKQTKDFASSVGNTFHHGFSYIYPTEVKFFNPHKGMFKDKDDRELKVAAEGKELVTDEEREQLQAAANSDNNNNKNHEPAPKATASETIAPPYTASKQVEDSGSEDLPPSLPTRPVDGLDPSRNSPLASESPLSRDPEQFLTNAEADPSSLPPISVKPTSPTASIKNSRSSSVVQLDKLTEEPAVEGDSLPIPASPTPNDINEKAHNSDNDELL